MSEKTIEHRNGLMTALPVAERIISTTPVVPHEFTVHSQSLEFYFHMEPEQTVAFAAAFRLEVSLREDHGGKGRPFVEARGAVDGVSVRAWSLGDAEEMDRYRAAVAPVGLPSEWVAGVPA